MKRFLFSLFLSQMITLAALAQNPDAILGVWHSPHGKTDMEIIKKGDTYSGVTTLLSGAHDVHGASGVDTGVVILKDFKYRGNGIYTRGKVVDLRSGRTHNGQIRLINNDKINIRIYFGIIQIGRTEMWVRVKQ